MIIVSHFFYLIYIFVNRKVSLSFFCSQSEEESVDRLGFVVHLENDILFNILLCLDSNVDVFTWISLFLNYHKKFFIIIRYIMSKVVVFISLVYHNRLYGPCVRYHVSVFSVNVVWLVRWHQSPFILILCCNLFIVNFLNLLC